MRALNLWFHILKNMFESGAPYILFKDACNKKSNQKNLGTIKSSNLCSEIIEYTNSDEIAVCNLASLCLPTFIKDGKFDFKKLIKMTRIATYNLNNVIDITKYPVIETSNSNLKHRPIGIGVQGLFDVYAMFGYPAESKEAKILNKKIFETIYYAFLLESNELAKKHGPYSSYEGSPISQNIFTI